MTGDPKQGAGDPQKHGGSAGEKRTAGDEQSEGSLLFGFLFIALIVYAAAVWPHLPQGIWWRLLITAGVVAAVVASWLLVKKSPKLKKHLAAPVRVASDFLAFLVVVATVIVVSIVLDPNDQVLLLKLFAVLYFSMLPAILYLQFSSRKTLALWKEYVLNLYKLKADDAANLPRPPTSSRFFPEWRAARIRAYEYASPKDRRNLDDLDRKLETANIYRVKFRDLFGRVPHVEAERSVLSVKSVHKLQVVITTVLITLGWIFVVQPEDVLHESVLPNDFQLAHLPEVPRQTLAWAFLGAYFYILQMLIRRYFQNDLKATAYINATMRIVVVILVVWALDPLLADTTSQAQRNAIAFVIGVFPTIGWQLLAQTVRRITGLVIPDLQVTYKLTDLDGLNVWYESRLLEVGVEDMQNLATTDIVDLMLNTRIPVDRLIDWIDQAFLYLRIAPKPERELLRGYGIRTATDLLDVYKAHRGMGDLLPAAANGNTPSRVAALVVSLGGERNLQHVQAWKRYAVERVAEPAAVPEPEPAPDAAPVPATT